MSFRNLDGITCTMINCVSEILETCRFAGSRTWRYKLTAVTVQKVSFQCIFNLNECCSMQVKSGVF